MSIYKNEIKKLADTTWLDNKQISKVVGCSEKTVYRYAGSFSGRCKEKSLADYKDSFEIHKTVLLPDIHYPHYDEKVLDSVGQFIVEYQPDELVYMGDQISLDCISGWNRRKPLLKERKRLVRDYEDFNKDILLVHENITPKDTKRVFMIGNHEQRINWYTEEHPELDGIIDIDRNLKLTERGYKIIPFNEIYRIGKLSVIHGYYWNKYHAARTLDAFEGNVVYSHVHNPQTYAKVSPVDRKGYHIATCLPCLCNIKPDYKKNAPNHWINGFGVVEHLPATGYFNIY
ncbi:MAG: hypothetical protein PVG65_05165, partial [Candidatus Thorarchaeota archaeon]